MHRYYSDPEWLRWESRILKKVHDNNLEDINNIFLLFILDFPLEPEYEYSFTEDYSQILISFKRNK